MLMKSSVSDTNNKEQEQNYIANIAKCVVALAPCYLVGSVFPCFFNEYITIKPTNSIWDYSFKVIQLLITDYSL